MDKQSCEAELVRVWGSEYQARMKSARNVFDKLSDETKSRIDQNGVGHIRALAAMGSEAYTNPKHPEHAKASSEANALYIELHGTETPLI